MKGRLVLSKSDTGTIPAGPAFESPRDRARFRRVPGFAAVEVMDACFRDHHFAPHTHDELMLGVMRGGVMRFTREGRVHTVGPGGISVVNPGEVHTGGRFEGENLVYTALYVPQAFLQKAGLAESCWIGQGVVTDRDCWSFLLAAAAEGADPLQAQENLLEGLARLGLHASNRNRLACRVCSAGAGRAIDYVHAHYAEPFTVEDLARVAGITPRHLIRSFRKATGLPPHAYLRQLRVEKARRLLRKDTSLAEIALAAGFADQQHLTKVFKQITGTTPGRYRLDMAA